MDADKNVFSPPSLSFLTCRTGIIIISIPQATGKLRYMQTIWNMRVSVRWSWCWCLPGALEMGIFMTPLSVWVLVKVLSFPPQVRGSGGPPGRPLPGLSVPFSRCFLANGVGQLQAETPAKSLTDQEALNAFQSLSFHICKMGSLGNIKKTKTDKAF